MRMGHGGRSPKVHAASRPNRLETRATATRAYYVTPQASTPPCLIVAKHCAPGESCECQ
jgi:hypothetical protein